MIDKNRQQMVEREQARELQNTTRHAVSSSDFTGRIAKVGVIGVGYYKYWNQFEGLLDDLKKKQEVFFREVKSHDVSAIDFGLVDNVEKAYEIVPVLKAAHLDLLFCDMLTYATSSTFGIIMRSLDIPIVLVALQPDKALDYTRASTYQQLYNDDICALPEFAGVAVRMGKRIPDVIVGTLKDDLLVHKEVEEYCKIAKVLHALKTARIGHIGHPIEAMLDMHTDFTMVTAHFGLHVVQCEAHEIVSRYNQVAQEEVVATKRKILSFFDTPEPVSDPISEKLTEIDLEVSAKASIALEHFVKEARLDGLAYYYEGDENDDSRLVMSNLIVGNSLLTGAGFPMCGESDIKTCIAMMIMDRLGIGGSFAEFHPIDFNENFVLVGHDGPHNIAIAEGKPVLRSLKKYHGKPGSGASVEFKIKEGPITILSINSTYDGKFKFIIAEGQSVGGPIPPTGNTNTRGLFSSDIRAFIKDWIKAGPTHHFSLGIGHHADTLKKIADYLNIESTII